MFRFVLAFLNSRKFNHLDVVGKTYTEHFSDSISYSWKCCKSSFYFLVHAIYPDIFKTSGSDTILNLSDNFRNFHV
jgi:hypothetical protein